MTGAWVIAGTPFAERYPCMCFGDRPCGRRPFDGVFGPRDPFDLEGDN